MARHSPPVAVITGGGGELGRALAEGFAAAGDALTVAARVFSEFAPRVRRARRRAKPKRRRAR